MSKIDYVTHIAQLLECDLSSLYLQFKNLVNAYTCKLSILVFSPYIT